MDDSFTLFQPQSLSVCGCGSGIVGCCWAKPVVCTNMYILSIIVTILLSYIEILLSCGCGRLARMSYGSDDFVQCRSVAHSTSFFIHFWAESSSQSSTSVYYTCIHVCDGHHCAHSEWMNSWCCLSGDESHEHGTT